MAHLFLWQVKLPTWNINNSILREIYMAKAKKRAEAYKGKGYGKLRYMLYTSAKSRIEECIEHGYYGEAVTIIESVITDRLESRISFLKKENVGFGTLGHLIKEAKKVETDAELLDLFAELDNWREKRNTAVHELVKIEDGQELVDWDNRMKSVGDTAREGYGLLKLVYKRVADLNPKHIDRIF